MLSGSTDEIAEQIRGYRTIYGISYIIVQMPHGADAARRAFAKVIPMLR